MAKRSLKRLDLDNVLLERLSKQGMHTCQDVLSLTRLEILKVLGISDKKRKELVEVVSKGCSPKPHTAYELHVAKSKESSRLSLCIPQFDDILGGGLPVGNITEIVGPSGVGKTQFCFLLSVSATLPVLLGGLDSQVIYIDTESTFSPMRIMEIAKTRFPAEWASEEELRKLMRRVYVYTASTTEALKQILQKIQWDIIRTSTKLVIIDSIASLVRKEFGTAGIASRTERSNLLVEQAAVLKDIAESLGIAVVVTNQITSRFQNADTVIDSEEKGFDTNLTVDQEHIVPALGVTWAHCVNTRFLAQFVDATQRQLLLIKSSHAPFASIPFTIQKAGIIADEPARILSVSDPQQLNIQTRHQFLDFES